MSLVVALPVPCRGLSDSRGSMAGAGAVLEFRRGRGPPFDQPLAGRRRGPTSRSGRDLHRAVRGPDDCLRRIRARRVGAVVRPRVRAVRFDAQEPRVDERVQRSLTPRRVKAVEPLGLCARQALTRHFQKFRPNPFEQWIVRHDVTPCSTAVRALPATNRPHRVRVRRLG